MAATAHAPAPCIHQNTPGNNPPIITVKRGCDKTSKGSCCLKQKTDKLPPATALMHNTLHTCVHDAPSPYLTLAVADGATRLPCPGPPGLSNPMHTPTHTQQHIRTTQERVRARPRQWWQGAGKSHMQEHVSTVPTAHTGRHSAPHRGQGTAASWLR